MVDYSGQQGGGMLSQSPYYSYNQSFVPNVPMNSPTTGMTGMADALINGYSQYLQGQKGGTPMQMSSGAPQNNLGSMIAGLFKGPQTAMNSTTPDPSTAGVY